VEDVYRLEWPSATESAPGKVVNGAGIVGGTAQAATSLMMYLKVMSGSAVSSSHRRARVRYKVFPAVREAEEHGTCRRMS